MPEIPKLIQITDRERLPGEGFFDVVKAALEGGVDAILVREKKMDSAKLLAFSSRLRSLTHQYHAQLIIHSQADIAKAVGADGVHIASDALNEIPAIRAWLNDGLDDENMSISASCHDAKELDFAYRFGADYAFLSPVFATQSHPGKPHIGIEAFKQIAADSPLPVIALGGINKASRQQVGDYGVAVLGTILDAENPRQTAGELRAVS